MEAGEGREEAFMRKRIERIGENPKDRYQATKSAVSFTCSDIELPDELKSVLGVSSAKKKRKLLPNLLGIDAVDEDERDEAVCYFLISSLGRE